MKHRILNYTMAAALGIAVAALFGADPSSKTSAGLWPTDHAGVAAQL
jgi:hypothetical protein